MKGDHPLTVWAAIAANALIAVAKFAAAFFTGSSSMIAEGIHSVVDTGNEGLMLLGLRRSKRPPDEEHPFGYGKELYFWSLVVAIVLFGLGGGTGPLRGHPPRPPPGDAREPAAELHRPGAWPALSEGTSWTLALRKLRRDKRDSQGVVEAVHASKDPTTFVVLMEDSAALAGIAVAAAGVFLSHRLGKPWIDGAASIVIGLILGTFAFFLAYECRALLLGESADQGVRRDLERVVERSGSVEEVHRLLTMQMAPDQVLVNLDARFDPEARVGRARPGDRPARRGAPLGPRLRAPGLRRAGRRAGVARGGGGRRAPRPAAVSHGTSPQSASHFSDEVPATFQTDRSPGRDRARPLHAFGEAGEGDAG